MKSGFPYLVDISLSNQCAIMGQCRLAPICYASPENKVSSYPDMRFVRSVLKELAEANVLEVVFGGESEPTTTKLRDCFWGNDNGILHEFSHVLYEAKYLRFKIGVTTRNYNLHNSPKVAKAVMECCNSVAFSVNTPSDIENALHCIQQLKKIEVLKPPVFYFQDVLEVKPYKEFLDFLNAVFSQKEVRCLTLLGYKDFGLAAGKKQYDYGTEWIDAVRSYLKDNYGFKIGVDSILVNTFREELLERGVKDYYLVGREGDSSCYVDCFKQLIRPSSFTTKGIPWEEGKFLEIFSQL